MTDFVQYKHDTLILGNPAAFQTALRITWGDGVIILGAKGDLTLEGFPSLDAAAQGFWRAIAKWAPAGVTVTLPEGYGEEASHG